MKKIILKILIINLFIIVLISCTQESYISSEIIEDITAPFEMPELKRPEFSGKIFKLVNYGAVEGGLTLNKTAFSEAINACSEAGGGTVLVPAGKWLTVPIELKSDVNLHLQKGAEVIFTYDKTYFFPDSISRVKGDLTKPLSPIYARNAENIAITGHGVLDGQGVGWWPFQDKWWENHKKDYNLDFYEEVWRGVNRDIEYSNNILDYMDDQSNYGDDRPVAIRPSMLKPINCKNILFEDFTIKNSPMWTVNPVMCENIIIRRLTITANTGFDNHHTPNTDGINPESSKNVLIEYCDIITGDDSYAIKSGIDEAGRKRGIPSENIVIRNCRNRRISIGSEMSGGVRNVFVKDCKVVGEVNRAIHIKTVRGRGGIVENLWFENIQFDSVKENAIFVNMLYGEREEEPVSERTPVFRNFYFKNISGGNAERSIAIQGIPEMPAQSVHFDKIDINSLKGVLIENAKDVSIKNCNIPVKDTPTVLIENSTMIAISQMTVAPLSLPKVELKGNESQNITLPGIFFENQGNVILTEGASEESIRYENRE